MAQQLNGTGGPQATANIINQRADASRSLYQICIALSQRLAQVPGFEEYLQQLDPADPVESLWALFKTGHPLLTIYNAVDPPTPLRSDDPKDSEAKKRQKAIFRFSTACVSALSMTESFILRDLDDNDTTGFVKVTQVVNRVLDIAGDRGLLLPPVESASVDAGARAPGGKMTQRDYVVREIVDTERKYVQDLENLHDLKIALEQKGDLAGDYRHAIFMNINAILDFQRRFLIRIEATNSMAADQQQWGSCFTSYEEGFNIYHQFIAGHQKAAETALREFDKIRLAEHPVAADQSTLDGFLLKPMQRLTKYPLFLKDLGKNTENPDQKAEVLSGAEAANRVLKRANEAVEQRILDDALANLISRVDDWKSHHLDDFGKLLMHGHHAVLTGKSGPEKEYDIYLFESILFCCQEVLPNRSKEKKDKTKPAGARVVNKNAKLQLKGRIFMANVTDVVSLSKPGSHSIQIWWRGDPGVENFTIKFPLEDTMKHWATALDIQRLQNTTPRASQTVDRDQFAWMNAQQSNLENPYVHQQEEEESDDSPASAPAAPFMAYQPPPGSALARNASAMNLRQRSMTGESTQSLASVARGPPPRFPIPMPTPLSLQTSVSSSATSPGPRNGDSYFSPVVDSPPSSRVSTTSGFFPGGPQSAYTFPRAPAPAGANWEDNSNRYTAPAMPRAPSRDGPTSAQYGMNGRQPRGPSLPVPPPKVQSAAQLQRSRSYSTADINGLPAPRRNTQGAPTPAVPGIPAYVHEIPRSQTASPRAELPVRTNTQSPGAQRDRIHHQHTGSLGGTMAHFPTQPTHRQLSPNPPHGPQDYQQQQQQQQQQQMGHHQHNSISRTVSPALGVGPAYQSSLLAQSNYSNHSAAPSSPDGSSPSQLKVRVTCDSGACCTLVVFNNITYQSLIDRIDAKLARFTPASLSRGSLKLRYQDEDGDYVTIESDDDIQIAFQEWKDMTRNLPAGDAGEIQLYCFGDIA